MHLGYLELGDIRVDVIDGGDVWMDGGGIFGVVPKSLWSRVTKADAENRVRLSFFSLLVRSEDATIVIEAGAASHQPAKAREHLAADDSRLVETLSSIGVEPEDVEYFIPSHLHYDHVGGASSETGARLVFPNAQHVFQRIEWDEARNPIPINRNAYLREDIAPLENAKLMIVDGDAQIVPGIEVILTGGHSLGHQMVKIGRRAGELLYFTGDIVPTSEHISPRWMCAFDIEPIKAYDRKVELLTHAADEGLYIAPGHGGQAPICTVSCTSKGRFIANRLCSISPPQ